MRLGKPLAHGSASLLASTALYFGLNSLASVWKEDPGIPTALLAGVGHLPSPSSHPPEDASPLPPRPRVPPTSPHSPQLAALELGELRSAITELVQRSDPPHH
uniref:Uncharacterized protein n=1 Tax=Globodera rostochiensis TaxID=31243 RepID=A0A914GSM0_GLORO